MTVTDSYFLSHSTVWIMAGNCIIWQTTDENISNTILAPEKPKDTSQGSVAPVPSAQPQYPVPQVSQNPEAQVPAQAPGFYPPIPPSSGQGHPLGTQAPIPSGYPPGLEYLLHVDQLLINQQVELLQGKLDMY